MYEHDSGNDDTVSELLAAAMEDRVIRPSAYIDLAEIRYSKATAKPLGASGKINAAQAVSIVGPLKLALENTPLPEPYWLIARTWEVCDARPPEEDIKLLARGVRLFPRITKITYRSALVGIRNGDLELANEMIESGRHFVTKEADIGEFDRLRSTAANPRVNGNGP